MFYFADSDDAADSVVGGEDRGAAFCAGQAPCRADGGGKGISERGAGGSGPRRGGGEARADGSPEELDFEIAWRQSNPNPAIEKLLQWVETHEYVE